ncbi:MAG: cysteine synthase family protein [Clostridiales Family XIII bacterium]|nr:cysteine synthase family protein [Clostridiales Family XIII bacterium]
MNYYTSMKDLIGNTPLVELTNVGINGNVRAFAKLELWNPGGSVKDRIGKYMIDDAIERGVLKDGATIVEGTAGNTGLGIAFYAIGLGYKVIFVVPEKFSEEKQTLMRAFGAEIVNTPKADGMLGAAAKAEEIKASIPGAVSFQQFKNPANPKAHYETTGPEIYDALDGQIDYVVIGAGSGGTYTGVLKYLKERNPNIKGVLADPLGSVIGGGEHFDYDIEGIGNDFVADTMDINLVDKVIKVSDVDAYENARLLATKEGIIAGSSSGAALTATLELAKELEDAGESANIVTLFPDRGDRYFSKNLYNIL